MTGIIIITQDIRCLNFKSVANCRIELDLMKKIKLLKITLINLNKIKDDNMQSSFKLSMHKNRTD